MNFSNSIFVWLRVFGSVVDNWAMHEHRFGKRNWNKFLCRLDDLYLIAFIITVFHDLITNSTLGGPCRGHQTVPDWTSYKFKHY